MTKTATKQVESKGKGSDVEQIYFPRPTSPIATVFSPRTQPVSIAVLKKLIKTSTETKWLLLDLEGIRYLLSLNKRNRPLSDKRARDYQEQMQTGEWRRTGEVVIFTTTGVMNTGQHRLRGAELYGKPVWFNISFGIDEESFAVTDTGRPHSAADVLSLMGVKNYALVAATLRLLLQYKLGLPQSSTRAVGPALIQRAMHDFSDISETTSLFVHYNYPTRGFRTAVLNAVTWLSIHAYGEAKTKKFLQSVADGAGILRSNPAYQLRERLLRDDKARIGQVERFALALKALIAFQEGKTISALAWRVTGRSPEAFPVVPGSKMLALPAPAK